MCHTYQHVFILDLALRNTADPQTVELFKTMIESAFIIRNTETIGEVL